MSTSPALSKDRAALLVVDIQDRLAAAMPDTTRDAVIRNTNVLIEAAKRFGLPPVPWKDWEVKNFAGMGLWSLTGDWFAQFDRDTVTMEDYREFESLLSGPRTETVKRWDAVCRERRAISLKLEPDSFDAAATAPAGFRTGRRSIQPPRTIVIDLKANEERMLDRMEAIFQDVAGR